MVVCVIQLFTILEIAKYALKQLRRQIVLLKKLYLKGGSKKIHINQRPLLIKDWLARFCLP